MRFTSEFSSQMGGFEANAPPAFQQRESLLRMHLKSFPIINVTRFNEELEIPMDSEPLLKKPVDLFPAVPVLPGRPVELKREPAELEHKLAEDGRRNGQNGEKHESEGEHPSENHTESQSTEDGEFCEFEEMELAVSCRRTVSEFVRPPSVYMSGTWGVLVSLGMIVRFSMVPAHAFSTR